jgi:hypothetical protein
MVEFTQGQLEGMVVRLQEVGFESLDVSQVCNLLFGYSKLKAERDALAAELATVKAALPKWWRCGDSYYLAVKPDGHCLATIWLVYHDIELWACGTLATKAMPLADAMLAGTEALGLPPCEVCDE